MRLAINSPQLLDEVQVWARSRRNFQEKMHPAYAGDYSMAPNYASFDALRRANAARGNHSSSPPFSSQWSYPTVPAMPNQGQNVTQSMNSYPGYSHIQPPFSTTGPTPIQPITVYPQTHQSGIGAPLSYNSGGYGDNSMQPFGHAYSAPSQYPYNYGYAHQASQYGSHAPTAYPQAGQPAFPNASYADGQAASTNTYYNNTEGTYLQQPSPSVGTSTTSTSPAMDLHD